MTDYSKRSACEARTYELFGEYLKSDKNWTPGAVLVANVFRAKWEASLTAAEVNKIGAALNHLTECETQPVLTRLVKAKVLRTRMLRGQRLYEVNY